MPLRSSGTIIFVTFTLIFSLMAGYGAASDSDISDSLTPNKSPDTWKSSFSSADAVPGEYIVKFKKGLSNSSKVQIMSKHAFQGKKDLKIINARLVSLDSKTEAEQKAILADIAKDPSVEYIQPNYRLYPYTYPISDDEFADLLWGLKNYGQIIDGVSGTAGVDINLEPAWQMCQGSADVVVAVIDTGTDIIHPDLAPNIWTNPDEVPDDGLDNDYNGLIDDINGWDFYNQDNSVYDCPDIDGHGTHLAGIIAAVRDSYGVAGVAPLVKIMPVKFIGSPDGGNTADAILAIEYAANKGVKFANCSWGSDNYDQLLYDAMAAAPILFIAAAGNESTNNDTVPVYPASFDLPNVISVAAIDNQGNLASFSNYGASVDVAAPGNYVLSTVPNADYAFMSGTSNAAPHVSGVAALMFSAGITDLTTIKNRILDSARHHQLNSLSGKVFTGGVIDAEYCLNLPPAAGSLAISGIGRIKQSLSGSYIYSDDEEDPEGSSIYQWYRADTDSGTAMEPIPGANDITYMLTQDDLGKYMFFSVTPIAAVGHIAGDTVYSTGVGPVDEALTLASPLEALSIYEGIGGSSPDLINNFTIFETNYAININTEATDLIIDYIPAPAATVTVYYNDTTVTGNSIVLADGADIITLVVHEEGKEDLIYTINISREDNCFIATAAFGSRFTPSVALLRTFRDDYLLTNAWGKQFVEFYYRNSPPVASFIAHREILRGLTRVLLIPLVAAVYLLYHKLLLVPCLLLILWFWAWKRKVWQIIPVGRQL